MLVRDGLLTSETLEEALVVKEQTGQRLGEILVERGWVSGAAIARALAEQHGLDYLELAHVEPDRSATVLLPEKFARRYQALPISFEGDALLIAVADPTDVVSSDDLRLAVGMPVRFAVVSLVELQHATNRVYRSSIDLFSPDEDEQEVVDEPPEHAAPTRSTATQLVNELISHGFEDGASDLHFEPQEDGMIVRARIDGVTRKIAEIPLATQASVTARLKVMGELDIAEKRVPQDGRVSVKAAGQSLDLRIAVLPTTYGEQIVLRILHRASGRRTLADLGMSPAAAEAFTRSIRQPYGAVITCGPTGSGKTTTLYAGLEMLNEEGRVLTTIEDPVEHQIPGVNQVEVHTRSGLTFARGLRTILRSDPDVLLVGEIRDEETARIAIQAAMTGHLVLTTLHTHNASSSIARLKNLGVEPELLGTSINCIVAQRLARRLCTHCREAYVPGADELAELGNLAAPGLILHRAVGCAACAGVGYTGRVALYEVMEVRGRIRALIGASTDEIFAAAVEQGMLTLRQDGLRLCVEGVSALDEIRRVTGDRLV